MKSLEHRRVVNRDQAENSSRNGEAVRPAEPRVEGFGKAEEHIGVVPEAVFFYEALAREAVLSCVLAFPQPCGVNKLHERRIPRRL